MRVIVFCKEYLLASAIESLLTGEGDLISLNFTKNKSDLNNNILNFNPNVIITDDESIPDVKFEFAELLRAQIGLKILVVNKEQNLVNLFVCQKIPITRSGDLLQAIYS